VKGQAFPPPPKYAQDNFVFLQASSYAFANCFTIEKELGKKYQKPWYVDCWIADHIKTPKRPMKEKVKLMPYSRKRYVYIYDGYLWNNSEDSHFASSQHGGTKQPMPISCDDCSTSTVNVASHHTEV